MSPSPRRSPSPGSPSRHRFLGDQRGLRVGHRRGDQAILGLDPEIVNVNGSGCSLGHPIGCTGARMIVTMVNELERSDSQFGAVAMCAAGGMGSATIIERV